MKGRINLNRYQKALLIGMALFLVVFAILYIISAHQEGYLYRNSFLSLSKENGGAVYTGKVDGKAATITVSPEKAVLFAFGEKRYGPYTVREDPAFLPGAYRNEGLTGVEIRLGSKSILRGGYDSDGYGMMLYYEDEASKETGITMQQGSVVYFDADGTIVNAWDDADAPSCAAILELAAGSHLVRKCSWGLFLLGVFLCLVNTVMILFAYELFRLQMSLRIQNARDAQPSDFERNCWYISWTVMTGVAFVCFLMGLRLL
ncbi:MAG: hypothetical protein IIY94_02020 [Oscillospiraceae bacterium]|nr:hypothetical protein [Oscillospiraceae bacterium]